MTSNNKIPLTDSIHELAYFWDKHDLTDYEDELEEIREPVFERKTILKINLRYDEANKVKKIYVLVVHAENQVLNQDILKENSFIDKIFTTDSLLTKKHQKITLLNFNKEKHL